jgi:hypothetical protein
MQEAKSAWGLNLLFKGGDQFAVGGDEDLRGFDPGEDG